ncbi:hypothetical protein Pelo_12865 [Pelomyxa schiedti]|nr:hypothetical protein Pelo_12865 [Pelomyxa schiedti]
MDRTDESVVVVGHSCPDVDSFISTFLAVKYLAECHHVAARGVYFGSGPDQWTLKVLRESGLREDEYPQSASPADLAGSRVFLVDHGMPCESFGTNEPRVKSIVGVVDHHRRGCCEPNDPVLRIKLFVPEAPSASYLMWKLMTEAGLEVDKRSLRLMLFGFAVDLCCCLKEGATPPFVAIYNQWVQDCGLTREYLEQWCLMDVDSTAEPQFLATYGRREHLVKLKDGTAVKMASSYAELYRNTPQRTAAILAAAQWLREGTTNWGDIRLAFLLVRDFESRRTTMYTAGPMAEGAMAGPIVRIPLPNQHVATDGRRAGVSPTELVLCHGPHPVLHKGSKSRKALTSKAVEPPLLFEAPTISDKYAHAIVHCPDKQIVKLHADKMEFLMEGVIASWL